MEARLTLSLTKDNNIKRTHHRHIQLFRVNRQVYEEASSFFYKNNAFRICNGATNLARREHDVNDRHLSRAAVSWLQKLGSQAQMVCKLELDVGQICSRLCNQDQIQAWGHHPTLRDEGQIELAPLLCLMWGQSWATDITFVQPASESTYARTSKFHKTATPAPAPPGESTNWHCRLPKMTDLLQALLRTEDSDTMNQPDAQSSRPHIRKDWRTIGSLCICRDGIGGIVEFKTTFPNISWNMGLATSPNTERAKTVRTTSVPLASLRIREGRSLGTK